MHTQKCPTFCIISHYHLWTALTPYYMFALCHNLETCAVIFLLERNLSTSVLETNVLKQD